MEERGVSGRGVRVGMSGRGTSGREGEADGGMSGEEVGKEGHDGGLCFTSLTN